MNALQGICLEVSFAVVDSDMCKLLTVLAGMFAIDCVLCRTVSQLFACVLVPIYILHALNMRTCLNQLTMSSVTYFISQANAGIRFSQDKRKLKVWRGFGKNEGEWTGEAEIRTRKKLWH